MDEWFGAQRAVERSSISISKMSTTITFHLQLYCSIYKHRILHRSATESNPEPPLVYRLASLASLGGSEKEALHEVQNTTEQSNTLSADQNIQSNTLLAAQSNTLSADHTRRYPKPRF